jgi:hypothetical protein
MDNCIVHRVLPAEDRIVERDLARLRVEHHVEDQGRNARVILFYMQSGTSTEGA